MLRPPGPKPHFLIGNIPLEGQGPLDTFRKWAASLAISFTPRRKIWISLVAAEIAFLVFAILKFA
jgi:hypothetical protein